MGLKRWSAILALLALATSAVPADVVKLKDGREFVGLIVEEQSRSIRFDTKISNIRTTITLQRREILSIERADLPDGFFENKPAASTPAKSPDRTIPASREPRQSSNPAPNDTRRTPTDDLRYLEIPITGVFGEDIIPLGVSEALAQARRRGVEHILFHIDSGGGQVWAADDIAAILDANDDDFTYHALVKHAGSAAIWVALSCDTISMTPGSSMGAAVVFTQDATTGAAEVDAKMNSAIAAKLAARAQAKGHDPVLVRAMVLAEAEAYAWKDERGVWRTAPERPKSGANSLRTVDARDTVLTLTAAEADELGFARLCERASADELGAFLNIGEWRSAGVMGAAQMQRARAKAKPLFERFNYLLTQVYAAVEVAQNSDPHNYPIIVDYNGNLSDGSRRDWQRRTDEALRAWDRVQAALVEIEKLEREREALAMSRWVDTVDLKTVYNQVADNKRRLQEERDRR